MNSTIIDDCFSVSFVFLGLLVIQRSFSDEDELLSESKFNYA